jgi:hypothetical protein
MTDHKVLVIGAGMGGLAAAIDLARAGCQVTVIEKSETPGGKMRQLHPGGGPGIDAGPTVFTMRWVFESLFADAGATLSDHVTLGTADILARHGWTDGSRLDLFADMERSIAAIGDLAGKADAEGYRAFCARSAAVYAVLQDSYICAQRPGLFDMAPRVGPAGIPALMRTAPHRTLWAELGRYFRDPRLRQLFGRYATYTGSSPFAAPATLDTDWDISTEAFEEVTTRIRATAPFVILDLPHLWSPWMRRTLISADEVVVVATPDLAALRNAKNMIDLVRQGRPNDAPPRLVLNQVGVPGRPEIPAKDCGAALGVHPSLIIPFDAKTFGAAANNGQMILDAGAKTKAAEAFQTLAQIVSRRELPAAAAGKPVKAARPAEEDRASKSLFGSLFKKR